MTTSANASSVSIRKVPSTAETVAVNVSLPTARTTEVGRANTATENAAASKRIRVGDTTDTWTEAWAPDRPRNAKAESPADTTSKPAPKARTDVDLDPVIGAGHEHLTIPVPERDGEGVRQLSLSDRRNAVSAGCRRFGPQAREDQLDCDRIDIGFDVDVGRGLGHVLAASRYEQHRKSGYAGQGPSSPSGEHTSQPRYLSVRSGGIEPRHSLWMAR